MEQGWIVALSKEGLVGEAERRIDIDPRHITEIEIIQMV